MPYFFPKKSIATIIHSQLLLHVIQLLRLYRAPQPRRKTLVAKKNNLAGVLDNRCNNSARIRMECVIVPSWPLPGTRSQVNITTVANSHFPLPSGGNCCQSSTGTAVPCRSCGPAVGDGTTRGGLVGHYATLAPTLRCDPWSRLCH